MISPLRLMISALLLAATAAITTLLFCPKTSNTPMVNCPLTADLIGAFVDVPGGGFIMGADPVYAEEGPPTKVFVSPFRMQLHEVTNHQFSTFVTETGYITEAEQNSGSALFVKSRTPENFMSWWRLDPLATWKAPRGEGSDLEDLDHYPVVHISLNDARAYAAWANGRLPTEVEWEYAASLGLFDPDDPFSGMRSPNGTARANIWTGFFPIQDTGQDGFEGLAPVGCFEPGKTGLYDMIGNVWEWTENPYEGDVPRITIKGGSYLCSDTYCRRYRVAARDSMEPDFSSSHVGFRILKAPSSED